MAEKRKRDEFETLAEQPSHGHSRPRRYSPLASDTTSQADSRVCSTEDASLPNHTGTPLDTQTALLPDALAPSSGRIISTTVPPEGGWSSAQATSRYTPLPSERIEDLRERESTPVATSVRQKTPLHNLCFRITNVPLEWSKNRLLETLQSRVKQLIADPSNLSLYPACCDANSQTALLELSSIPPDWHSIHESPRFIHLGGKSHLVVDSHFHGLTALNTPSDDTVVDIIAVTGLAGHAFGSWRHRETNYMWLRDSLPEDVQRARIMTYGYNTQLLGPNATTESLLDQRRYLLEDLCCARSIRESRRPIIFITHSLGGIVVLQALLQSKSQKNFEEILDATRAIFFFGTPLGGMRTHELEAMVYDSNNGEETQSSRVLEHLREGSEFLESQKDLLVDIWNKLTIYSYYETKQTATVARGATGEYTREGELAEMVKKVSALLYLPRERRIPVPRNHTDMVKFHQGDNTYIKVKNGITECVDIISSAPNADALNREQLEILRWISSIEYKAHHESAREGLVQGTGNWLYQNPEFRGWCDSSSRILLLYGIPGAGKTKIMARLIENHLHLQDGTESGVVYFYANRDDPSRHDPLKILRTLLAQLCFCFFKLRHKLPEHIERTYREKQHEYASGTLMFDDWHKLFRRCLMSLPSVILMLDALDEIHPNDRGKILNVLKELTKAHGNVKMFLSSREKSDISSTFGTESTIYINAADNKDDMNLFVDQKLRDAISGKKLLSGNVKCELWSQIAFTLSQKAEGMFLWVDFQIKYLCEMDNDIEVVDELGKLPIDLETVYRQLYKKIKKRPMSVALPGLVWLLQAQTPLSPEAWAEGVGWALAAKDAKGRVPQVNLETLRDACEDLIILDYQQNIARFAHLSVREFLEENTDLSDAQQEDMAARACLAVLQHPTTLAAQPRNLTPFHQYAVRYWFKHVQQCDHSGSTPELRSALCSFLGSPAKPSMAYACWLAAARKIRLQWDYHHSGKDGLYGGGTVSSKEIFTSPNPLIAAAYFEFEHVCPHLWETATHGQYGMNEMVQNLVSLRGFQGYLHVVQLLLRDANFTVTDEIVTAAAGAEHYSSKEVMELLLQRNSNLTITEGAIIAAVKNERYGLAITKLLLQRDPNLSITEGVLTAAAKNWQGGQSLMELLLQRDGNLTITEGATIAAAKNQTHGRAIMELLLQRDPNLSITEGVLTAAAGTYGSDKAFMYLLQRDANLTITEGILTAVAESWQGGQSLMELLLQRDANLTITESVLIAATNNMFGAKRMMELLLQRGANLTITEDILIAAAGAYDTAEVLMDLLLQKDANLTITEGVLTAAAYNRSSSSQKVMKLLLQRDANLSITEGILIAAACNCDNAEALMDLLLQRDANLTITEGVLTAAARNYYSGEEVFKLLLQRNANLTITDGVVTAVESNRRCGAAIMEMLLPKLRDASLAFTDGAAAKIEQHFVHKAVMQQQL